MNTHGEQWDRCEYKFEGIVESINFFISLIINPKVQTRAQYT